MDEVTNEVQSRTKVSGNDDIIGPLKIAVVSDRSTALGFKLAGVEIVRIIDDLSTTESIESAIKDVIRDMNIRFIIITEPLVQAYGLEEFEKLRRTIPENMIITVIPDRTGSLRKIGEGHLWRLISRATGLKRSN